MGSACARALNRVSVLQCSYETSRGQRRCAVVADAFLCAVRSLAKRQDCGESNGRAAAAAAAAAVAASAAGCCCCCRRCRRGRCCCCCGRA
eukprot:3143150-Lingulodinium_polyedra.AAC.1